MGVVADGVPLPLAPASNVLAAAAALSVAAAAAAALAVLAARANSCVDEADEEAVDDEPDVLVSVLIDS